MGLHLVIHDSIRRDKEAGSRDVIQNQENAGWHQHRECGQTHDRCDKPSPGAERQAPQTHAARAHVERGGDEIERSQQLPNAENSDRQGPQYNPGSLSRSANLTHRTQGSVLSPASEGGPIRNEEGRHQH